MNTPTHTVEKNNAALLWSAAELLRGYFKATEYGRIILPLVVLRRLAAVSEPNMEQVRAVYEELGSPRLSELEDWQVDELKAATAPSESEEEVNPNHFFNVAPYTLSSILNTSENTLEQLEHYIESFSPNVQDIFTSYRFNRVLEELNESGLLYPLLKKFVAADLSPATLSNTEMGLVFEELIRKFSEDSAADNGEFFTPRDNISLAVQLAFAPDELGLSVLDRPSRSIYDPTAGTGGMLSVSEEYLKSHVNPHIDLNLFGQELNPESYAICLSDMILKGQPVENVRLGNTLSDDKHAYDTQGKPRKFDYILANPPYGTDWTNVERSVREEFARDGEQGRFVGLPRKSDGQLLFLSHIAKKLRSPLDPDSDGWGGRAVVVHNGSSLFSGNAGSGESQIRQWLMENDYVDAIVAIPTSMFYSTAIATFMWILDTNKSDARKGKVQLIDATACWSKMRKNLGQKSRYMPEEDIAEVKKEYAYFLETGSCLESVGRQDETPRVRSKVFDAKDFGYSQITIEHPLRARFVLNSTPTRQRLMESAAWSKLSVDRQEIITKKLDSFRMLRGMFVYSSMQDFKDYLAQAFTGENKLKSNEIKMVIDAAMERNENADISVDAKGNPIPDVEAREEESVPLSTSLENYLRDEVLSYDPDAWIDESKTKVGYEVLFNRYFYVKPVSRSLGEIDAELDATMGRILELLKGE